jgi:hypothetical protein
MQRLSVCGHDRELSAQQHAAIDHRMTVSVEPGSRRYADPSNCDLGLTSRIRKQELPIPALGSLDKFLDDYSGLARMLIHSNRRTARLKEKNGAKGCEDSNGLFYHRIAFFFVRLNY